MFELAVGEKRVWSTRLTFKEIYPALERLVANQFAGPSGQPPPCFVIPKQRFGGSNGRFSERVDWPHGPWGGQ